MIRRPPRSTPPSSSAASDVYKRQVTLSYEWRRDGTAIPGATTTTYVPVSGDVGHVLTVFVTGELAGYVSATALSDPTPAVVSQPSVTGGTVSLTGSARGMGNRSDPRDSGSTGQY